MMSTFNIFYSYFNNYFKKKYIIIIKFKKIKKINKLQNGLFLGYFSISSNNKIRPDAILKISV